MRLFFSLRQACSQQVGEAQTGSTYRIWARSGANVQLIMQPGFRPTFSTQRVVIHTLEDNLQVPRLNAVQSGVLISLFNGCYAGCSDIAQAKDLRFQGLDASRDLIRQTRRGGH